MGGLGWVVGPCAVYCLIKRVVSERSWCDCERSSRLEVGEVCIACEARAWTTTSRERCISIMSDKERSEREQSLLHMQ